MNGKDGQDLDDYPYTSGSTLGQLHADFDGIQGMAGTGFDQTSRTTSN
jgi:hypothetical protein